ncbi:MAG: HU family DNA-binding protein [Coprobacter sp.]|nr:HU family DNA-binding protein [Coprobacter sp.]
MSSKISLPEMADLLARKSECTKKEAEAFLKEFFGLATEVLSSGETLKINGLGTFKPVWVEKRSSINVQTGQPCEIPGHYKLSFVPDKNMKDAVNAPFSCFDVEELADGVEIKDMEPVAETTEAAEEVPGDEPEQTFSEPEPEQCALDNPVEDVIIASVTEETPEPENSYEPEEVVPDTDGPGSEQSPDEEGEEADTDDVCPVEVQPSPAEPRTSCRGFWYGFLTALILFLIVDLVWLYCHGYLRRENSRFVQWVTGIVQPRPDEKPVQDSLATVPPLTQDSTRMSVANETDTVEPRTDVSLPEISDVRLNPEPVVTATVKDGIYLTTLSLKHYGHKAFWVYIYQENQSKIANPNRVPIGMKVVIPDKSKYDIDAESEISIQKAKDLAAEILSEFE